MITNERMSSYVCKESAYSWTNEVDVRDRKEYMITRGERGFTWRI